MPNYRIVQHTYIDAVENPYGYGDQYFTIEQKVVNPFSIFSRLVGKTDTWYEWDAVTTPGTYSSNPLKFKTYKQARSVLEMIKNGQIVKGWKDKVIKEFEIHE